MEQTTRTDGNQAVETILSRRSIRRYTSEEVTGEQIQVLLRAAMAAPSAGNQQPWQFLLVTERGLLRRVPECHPYAYMMPEAALAIMVCADLTRVTNEGFWVQDCAAATQNMLLAAHATGLGAVWLGVYPREERVVALRHLLDVPDHIVPFALVAVGWPAEEKGTVDRFDSSRVHQNGW